MAGGQTMKLIFLHDLLEWNQGILELGKNENLIQLNGLWMKVIGVAV